MPRDSDLRDRMGTAGAANARHYAWPEITDKILSAYRAVLAPS